MFIRSKDADTLFATLNTAEPREVLLKLRFLFGARQNERTPLFEYDSDYNHAWYLVGLAYERNGELSKAANAFKRAAEIWTDDTDSFLAYSNVENDLAAQIEFLTWGLNQNNDPQIRYNFSNALIDANRHAEALGVLETIENDVPFYEDVRHSMSLARLSVNS